MGMGKENFNGYGYENTSTRTLPYPLTALKTRHPLIFRNRASSLLIVYN
jgi:hypothetical protein